MKETMTAMSAKSRAKAVTKLYLQLATIGSLAVFFDTPDGIGKARRKV
jgi:hypothetical protein